MSFLKYSILSILFCFLFEESNSQQIKFNGGVIPCGAEGVFNYNAKITDSNLNTYIVGQITANATYTAPIFKLIQTPNSYINKGKTDALLIKINKDGQIIWHSTIQGSGSDSYISVKLDLNENPIICGYASPSILPTITTISNYSETYSISPDYSAQPFLLKLNKTDGTIVKFKFLTTLSSTGTSVNSRVDAMNIFKDKIVVTGCFKGSAIQINGISAGNNGTSFDIYIISTDLDFNIDNFKILKRSASTAIASNINFIQKNDAGYFFSGTLYDGSITFPTSTGTRAISTSAVPYYDFFIYKTDNNLDGQWVLKSSFITNNYDKQITQTYIDQTTNNLIIVGNNKSGSFSIEKINSNILTSAGVFNNYNTSGNSSDIFIFKYNNSGDLVDSKILGDSNDQGCSDIFQFNNKLIISGNFKNSLIFGKDTLKTNGATDQDAYLAIIDKNDYSSIGAVQILGSNAETGDAIIYNNSNFNLLIGTTTSASITVPNSTPITIPSSSPKSIYVANACPIIGLFEDPSTNYFLNPSNPNGSLAITVKGDVPGGYSYSWSDGSYTGNSRTGLTEGNYTLTTSYLNGKCSKQRTFSFKNSIKEGTVTVTPTFPASCSPDNSIYAEATDVSGTNGVVQFSIDSISWNNGTLMAANKYNYTFSGLSDGVYQLYYRYQNLLIPHRLKGSVKTISWAGNPITSVTTTVKPVACHGESNGEITINATYTGTPDLNYSISGNFIGSYKNFNNFPGLPAQQCDIWVKDLTSNCTFRGATVNITDAAILTPSAQVCYSSESNTGGILVNVTGGVTPYSYQLLASDGVTPIGLSQLSNKFSVSGPFPVSYYVQVTDANGCKVNTNLVTIDTTAPTLIDFTALTIGRLCGVIPGRISISAIGGTGNYSYKLNAGTAQGQNTFENLTNGSYTVTLIDDAGCSLTKAAPAVADISPIPVSYFKANKE